MACVDSALVTGYSPPRLEVVQHFVPVGDSQALVCIVSKGVRIYLADGGLGDKQTEGRFSDRESMS